MKTIKFRGQCTSDSQYAGKWVEGNLVVCEDDSALIVQAINDHNSMTYHVKLDTVGQFTGLLDKNGKEIYEDDIVEWQQYGFTGQKTYTIKGVVYFDTDCGAYGLNTGFVEDFTWLRIFYNEVDLGDIAVIGNIHDNPELLKKEV